MSSGYERNINPNHPVTRFMDDQWHKIVALLMYRADERKVVIGVDVIRKLGAENLSVTINVKQDAIELQLVDQAEARRLAAEAGGLPV